ncbi:MAG: cyclic beta 1-2 glucan synthetase [Massilia sp.]|nr:cyclic beta 1-2 glucan synthetase [Massilia sp.]
MNEELHTLPGAPHAGDSPIREPGRDHLLARLDDNAAVIGAVIANARAAASLSSAAKALLDHHYLVDEQIRFVRRYLPREGGHLRGHPRIHQLALEAVAHGDGRLDHDALARFVAACQEGAPLALGELRAFPLMLRLALIDNLRRLAARLESTHQQRALARDWAGRMQATADARPGDLVLLMADMARAVEPMGAAFVSELARRLEGRDGPLAGVLEWLGTRLADDGLTLVRQLEADTLDDAADAVSLANSLASLGLVCTIDWQAFLEAASAVEAALRTDPAGVYPQMDAATREHYRHAVERLARQSGQREAEVAAEALALAGANRSPADGGLDLRTRHVGHYLVGDGLPALHAKLGQRPGLLPALRRAARRRPLLSYLGAAGTFTLLFIAALVVHAWHGGAAATLLALVGVLAACGASQLALALTDLMVTRLAAPRPLPRMDFGAGIPPDAQGMVVVPALVNRCADVASLCRRLELHYLANRDPQLRFCLLGDFADAPSETLPLDAGLLDAARDAIAALNARYGQETAQPFLLLQRRRAWSTSERAWIGRERRRGALADLNAFLRGGARERFALVEGSTDGLAGVRYVIALDADTQLPQGSAGQMVAAMAHPLNQPAPSADGRRVAAGHGFLQPRVTTSLPLDGSSRYARLCSGEPGIDPRPRPLPDVWQDLFGEGAAGGQGIYEVDTFARVLAGLPEDAVLSHDLLAGCYLRGGLLGDVQLYQPAAGRYSDDVQRRHRRMRGDWQLAGWLRTRIKTPAGTREPNPLPPLARWKLLDGLRRSLVAPTLTGMLVLCWAWLASPAFWSAAALSVFFLPAFIEMLLKLADKPHDALWRQHLANWGQDARLALRRAVMQVAVLPHEAWTSLDAIVRGSWRMLVSRRHLLQARKPGPARPMRDIERNVRSMWFALLLPACVAVLLTFLHPLALFAAAPLLLLWFLSPVIAWWVSQPGDRAAPALADSQALFLASVARRHWAYFDTFAGPGDNWLAPDSMQEHPHARVTHRTSPTDIGIGLLANLTAWDFGFIAQAEVLARVRAAFDSMALLARHRGHFCHWYDTQTLAPLQPMMVSTIDSGNLAAHLLTLAAGLEALADAPVGSSRSLAGMRATLQVVEDHAQEAAGGMPPALREAIARCRSVLQPGPARKTDTLPDLLDRLGSAAQAASAIGRALPEGAGALLCDWSARFEADCHAAWADLLALVPWMPAAQEYVFEASLTRIPTLRELATYTRPPAAADAVADPAGEALAAMVEEGAATARARLDDIRELAQRARAFADMDFGFLYQSDTGLLASGYNASTDEPDPASCDLLASEARLASFIGIARGQLPQAHWFALRRPLGFVDGEQLLLSGSGSMSDYLAPQLVMPGYRGTLFDKACQALVRVQRNHADRHGVPWGMSESGFNTFDAALNYGYRAFGVPGTGVADGPRPGIGDDLVIAPYASMLALMVAPGAACANLERMAGLGWIGQYGFYEAVDYTRARLPRNQPHATVRSFMAHHQGMGLLALSHLLHGGPMQARFEADAELAATLPLLYERAPKSGAFDVGRMHAAPAHAAGPPVRDAHRSVDRTGVPHEVQLLSNGRYHVMVTSDGAGYSRWHDLALTRWRADAAAAAANAGVCCYLRDLDSGAVWSPAFQPTLAEPEHYEAVFPEGRAEFHRVDDGIELATEIVVAPDDDVELRRMRIRNGTAGPRSIELTAYAEPVLAREGSTQGGVTAPLQSEILAERNAILCTRRPHGTTQAAIGAPWLLNLLAVHGGAAAAAAATPSASFETDRQRFIGRGNASLLPAALREPGPLGGEGEGLEPALAIRRVVTLAAGEEVTVDLVLGVAPTREEALRLVDKYGDRHAVDGAFELAWTQSQALLRQLDIAEPDAGLYARLAGAVLYPNRANRGLRAEPAVIAASRLGRANLWPYGISGDLPIVLVHVRDSVNLGLVRQLVQAHGYWRRKGLAVDLVLWYADTLQRQVARLVASGAKDEAGDGPGGLFAFAFEGMPEEDRVLMQAAARVVLQDRRGGLLEQLRRAAASGPGATAPLLHPAGAPPEWTVQAPEAEPLLPDNGIGGFSPDGCEYVIRTAPGRPTPAPWSNVLANPAFGAVVSESGEATSWSAHARYLTAPGEAFYLRDEATGVFWSPTALPAPSGGAYLTRHGFGYSVFEHTAHGIRSEMTSFVALEAPLKYTVLKLRNDSSAPRRLSVTGYVEWVMGEMRGEQRTQSALHVVTGRDPASGAIVARNPWHSDVAGSLGFFHVDAGNAAFTGDRLEFIGHNGRLADPQALRRAGLSGSLGAGFDPCAALQVGFELEPGEQKEFVFMLGAQQDPDIADIAAIVQAHQDAPAALEQVRAWWRETLGAVRIETPDPLLDVLANGWLLYGAIAGGMWARGGGTGAEPGAWRFRDHLQDAMAVVHARPQLLREQLLLCAAHQFVEDGARLAGYPPSNRGVRMRPSSDLLWLPLATCRYLAATGDIGVLGESVPWLEERALEAGEDAGPGPVEGLQGHGDLYEHCVRAIRHAMRFGEHGLPLVEGGDPENVQGGAESVQLGFFMVEVLRRFAEVADRRADYGFATTCRAGALALAAQIEDHAWDGELYRSSLDGGPSGGQRALQENACGPDLAVQAWAVLSGAASPERAAGALAAAAAHSMGGNSGSSTGQPLEAVVWAATAFARLGQGERAWQMVEIEAFGAPLIGRAAAGWYTGTAGPMYRLIVESLLGVERVGQLLLLAPQLPQGWPGFRLQYRYRDTSYAIEVRAAESGALLVDGQIVSGKTVQLVDDGATHRVELHVARRQGPAVSAEHEETQSKTIP